MPRTDPNSKTVLFQPGLYTFSVSALYQPGAAGVRFFLNMISISGAGASVQIVVEMVSPLGGGIQLLTWQMPVVTAPGTYEFTIYPNIQTAQGQAASDTLGGILQVAANIQGNTPQVEMSLCAVPIW